MKVLFDTIISHNKRGLGDILMTTPTIRALSKKYNCKIDYQADSRAWILLENNPFIGKLSEKFNPQDYDLVFRLDMRLENYSIKRNRQNRIDAIAELCGIQLHDKATEIYYPKKTIPNRIGIAIDSTNHIRSWRYDYLVQLIEKLQMFELYYMGIKPVDLPDYVNNLSGKQTIPELIKTVSSCSFIITTDSFLSHLAGALNIPAVVLYTETPKEWRCQYYKRTVGIQSPVPCSPCWERQRKEYQDAIEKCYQHQTEYVKCIDALTPEIVYNQFMKIVNNNQITIYHGKHFEDNCYCSFCLLKKELLRGLTELGYRVTYKYLDIDWDKYYPSEIHFNCGISYSGKKFGDFFFEGNKMPTGLVDLAMAEFDYILCSSKYIYNAWLNSGISESRLIHNSSWIDPESFDLSCALPVLYPDYFTFLAVGNWQHKEEWQDRKGLRQIIEIFNEVYGNAPDVKLIVKTDKYAPDNLPNSNIVIIRDYLSQQQMSQLYKSCDAYISAHKGEGFGRPVLEALYFGKLVGATGYGGVMDFLNKRNSILFDYELIDNKIYPRDQYKDGSYPQFAEPLKDSISNFLLNARQQNDMEIDIKEFHLPIRVRELMRKIGEAT